MQKKQASAYIRDMTAGNPVRIILSFAIPLFIGNIFQQFYSMADTMVVGYSLGDQGIAAIGATSSLYSLLINFANGLNNGYGIVVTQRFGAHDRTRMKQSIAGMILLDLIVTVILTVLIQLLIRPLMRFLNTPPEIFGMALQYIRIIFMGLVTTIGYNMCSALLRAMGNSRTPLYFLILSSILNIGLDLLFVVVLHWGIGGAAAATVISQAVSAVLCGLYVFKHYRDLLPAREDFRVSAEILKDLFSTGISMALMSCLVDSGSVIFSRANNLLGQHFIAAHAAARKLLMMMIQPQATIAVANATFVAQNWGAGNYSRIRYTLHRVLALEIIWSITASTIMYLFGAQLIRFTTGSDDSAIIEAAVLSLRTHFAAFPFLGVLFALRNALQSMGYKLVPVASSCIELTMKIFSAHFLVPAIGFLGTCITEPVTWVMMVTFLAVFYFVKHPASQDHSG